MIAELTRLQGLGLVARRTVGRSHAWKANRRHALFRLIRPLFQEEGRLRDRMLDSLRTATSDATVSRAIVFGSVARDADTPESDIALLVVTQRRSDVERKNERFAGLALRIHDEFGRHLSPIV